jgi:hypothetical protein
VCFSQVGFLSSDALEQFFSTFRKKIAASVVITALLVHVFAPISTKRTVSELALWLAGHLTEDALLTKDEVIRAAAACSTADAFFRWAGDFIKVHPTDFSFTHEGAPNETTDEEPSIRQAWDNRFQTSGMAHKAPRVELPKAVGSELNVFQAGSTQSNTVSLKRNTILTATELPVAIFEQPWRSGIVMGAP